MNVIREKINHRQFGTGEIIGQSCNTLLVDFGTEYGVRKFIYPSAFEGHLTLCNSAAQKQMDDELEQIHEQFEAEQRQRKEAEIRRKQEEEEQVILAQKQKQAAARKRASTKKTIAKRPKQTQEIDSAEEGDL